MNYNFYDKYYRSVKIFNIYILYLLCFGPLYCKDIFYRDACVPSWQNWQMDSTSCTWCTCSLPYSVHIHLLHYTPLYITLMLYTPLYSIIYCIFAPLYSIIYCTCFPPYFTILHFTLLSCSTIYCACLQIYFPLCSTCSQVYTVLMLSYILSLCSSILHFIVWPLYSWLFTVPGFLFTLNLCSPVVHYTRLYTVTVLYFTGSTPFDSVFVIHDKLYLWRT